MDQVQIIGVGNNTNVPLWATEKAQEQMFDAMKDHYKMSEKQSDELKKAFDDYVKGDDKKNDKTDKLLGDVLGVLKKIEKRGRPNANGEGKADNAGKLGNSTTARQGSQGGGNDVDKRLSDMSKALNEAADKRKKHTEELEEGTESVQEFSSTLRQEFNSLSSTIRAVNAYYMEQGTIYRDLYNNGVMLNTTISGLNREAGRTGMTLEEYSNVLSNNASILNRVGRDGFVSTVDEMTDSLASFGVTGKEAGQYFAEYMETQRMIGTFEQMDAVQRQAQAAKNIKTANMFAQALGKSREEIEAQMNQNKMEMHSRLLLATLDEKQRLGVEKNMEVFGAFGNGVTDVVTELAFLGKGMQNGHELIEALYATNNREAAETLKSFLGDLVSGEMDPKEIAKRMVAFGDSIDLQANHINEMVREGDLSAATAEQMLAMIDTANKFRDGLNDAGDGTAETLTRYEKNMREVSAIINSLKTTIFESSVWELLPVAVQSVVDIFTQAHDLLAPAILKLGNMFSEMSSPEGAFGKLVAVWLSLQKWAGSFTSAVKDVIKVFGQEGGVFKKLGKGLFTGIKTFLFKIPILGTILSAGVGGLTAMLETDGTWTEKLKGGIAGVFEGILDSFIGLPLMIYDFFTGANLTQELDKWWDDIRQKFASGNIVDVMWEGAKSAFSVVWDALANVGTMIGNMFSNMMDKMMLMIYGAMDKIPFMDFSEEIDEANNRIAARDRQEAEIAAAKVKGVKGAESREADERWSRNHTRSMSSEERNSFNWTRHHRYGIDPSGGQPKDWTYDNDGNRVSKSGTGRTGEKLTTDDVINDLSDPRYNADGTPDKRMINKYGKDASLADIVRALEENNRLLRDQRGINSDY